MKLSLTLLTLTAALGQLSYGQSASDAKTPTHGILGYLDTKSGAFRPLHQEAPDAYAVPNIAATTGKFVFTYTISVQSAISTSTPITCQSSALVLEVNSTTGAYREFSETAAVTASRSGSTATCTVTIPYSWTLATASSDSVTLSVGASAASSTTLQRSSYQDLPIIKVPANGVTTSQTVAITL